MSDLIPDLHRGTVDRNSLRQVLLIAAGIGTVVVFESTGTAPGRPGTGEIIFTCEPGWLTFAGALSTGRPSCG